MTNALLAVLIYLIVPIGAFNPELPVSAVPTTSTGATTTASTLVDTMPHPSSRRQFVSSTLAFLACTSIGTTLNEPAHASSAAYLVTAKLKKQDALRREQDTRQELASGVTVQEVRVGRQDRNSNQLIDQEPVVQLGSQVKAYVHVKDTYNRMLSRATAQFTVGTGQMLPSLEEGLLGMRVEGARRILVPVKLVEQGIEAGQLPVMQRELSRLDEHLLWNSDGGLAFDVEILALR